MHAWFADSMPLQAPKLRTPRYSAKQDGVRDSSRVWKALFRAVSSLYPKWAGRTINKWLVICCIGFNLGRFGE